MKVLLINGSPRKNGNTHLALTEVAKTLEAEGLETEIFWTKTMKYFLLRILQNKQYLRF